MRVYEYFINLDERGEFEADVRDDTGNTVFDFGPDIFEDGWVKHKRDLAGLAEFLVHLGIMKHDDHLIKGQ